MMNYLFVSGCPRSGTSALTELLSSHPSVGLGMERFKYLYNKKQICKTHFEEKYFFKYNENETNIQINSGKYRDYYKTLKSKYSSCTLIGDKYPQLYKYYSHLLEEFLGDVKFVFIIRNIEDVASSFNARAMNQNDAWPEENNYRKAVKIWNDSLLKAQKAKDSNAPIHLISYEKLFDDSLNVSNFEARRITEFLELLPNKQFVAKHKQMVKEYSIKIKPKKKIVIDGQMEYICQNANKHLASYLLTF